MIPISSRESVEFKDPTDGVIFKFKPKSGLLERELFDIWDDKNSPDERIKKIDSLIDKILLSPTYGDKPSNIFNSDEKAKIIGFWNDANKLTVEEKKS
jgi:hypothetical protein